MNSDEKTETEKTEIFRSIFRDIFPKCSLTFDSFQSQCKVKSCGLKIKISLTEDQERYLVCFCVCLLVCLSVSLSVCLYLIFPKRSLTFDSFEAQCKLKSCGLKIKISLTEDQERYLSLSLFMFVCLSFCLSVYLSVCLSACLPVRLSVRPSVRPFVSFCLKQS